MSGDIGEGGSKAQFFCLLCNSSLEHLRDSEQVQGQERALVPVATEASADQELMEDGEGSEPIHSSGDELSEADWIKKYQTFLSKTLHINFEEFIEDDPDRIKPGKSGTNEDVALFCSKCKRKIQRLYDVNQKLQSTTKAFEDLRDSIATTIARTFVDHKMMQCNDNGETEESEMEEEKKARTELLVEAWKEIYTGEADRILKERNLIAEIREEASARRDEGLGRTEFPKGTEVSAMELAKMQRMMTACYFTPKMSIVRKKGKLFFRVGIPRADKDKIYKCGLCEEMFNHQRSLNVHLRRHKTKNSVRQLIHSCLACGQVFTDRKDLIFHKKREHAGTTLEGQRIKYKRFQEFYACGLCTCKFSSKVSRNAHMKKFHTTEKLYPCTSCQDIFTTDALLQEHLGSAHTSITVVSVNNGDNSNPVEIFTCADCTKPFLKAKSLNEHMKVHSDPNISGCYYCGFGFPSLEALEEHTAITHIDPNPYNCEGCEEKFCSEALLLMHLKSHRFKTFMCETCGRVSRSKEAFKKHILTHTSTAKVETDVLSSSTDIVAQVELD